MKICLNCQHENLEEAKYCIQCGSKLTPSPPGKEQTPSSAIKKGQKEAERRQLTVLFCDLADSSQISGQFAPEKVHKIITGFHQVAEKVIFRNGGHIAQYLDNGLLVYFGYPKGLEDAPRAAVKSGIEILRTIEASNRIAEVKGDIPIDLRIGIHTGLVVVDDHLALGKAVNVAARLQGLAERNTILISPDTYKLTFGWFEVKSLGKHILKGISEPMEVYQVLHESNAITSLDVAKLRGLSPLVGRTDEMKIINDHWDKARKGDSHLILLYGEAGIGKSRLVDTLEMEVAGDPGAHLAIAMGSSYQQNSAFHPIHGMLGKYIFKFVEGEGTEEKLAKIESILQTFDMGPESILPLVTEFMSISSEKYPPLIMSPFAKREKTLEILTQLLLRQAEIQPLLIILEDLHWYDPSTLEWLNLFIEKIGGKNILILCTARPGFKADWQGNSRMVQINLKRLSTDNTAEICHHHTKGKTLPEEVLRQIKEKTEGVPLFVEELTKMLVESDMLVEKDQDFEIAGEISSLSIPSTLQDSLLARLDRLDEVKEIVQIGSVLGREFSKDILNAVLPERKENLEQSLYKLIDSEIFYQSGPENQKVYQFKHALIQDTAYESLLKSKRQKIHQKVADVLENQFNSMVGTQPELLAHHYTQASQPDQAIPLWLKAGQMASQKNATAEAIAHLVKGLDLLPNIKNERDRNNLELDFRLTLGGTYVVSHGFPHPKVKETFDQAREIAQKIEVNPKLALILLNLLSYYFNTEDYNSMQKISDYIWTLTRDPENGYWFELVVNQLSNGAMIKGQFDEANKGWTRVIELFNPHLPFPWELAPSGYIQIGAKAWQMVCLRIMGYMDRAKNLFDQHLSYAKDHKDSMTLYHIYTFPALYCLFTREWKTSERILEEYLPIVRKFGDPIFTLTAEVYYNIAKAFQGDQKALDTAVNLINVCFDVGFKAFAVTMAPFISELFFRIGEYESALGWIKKIMDHVDKTGSHMNDAELLRIKGLILEALNKPDAIVEDCFSQALELSRTQKAKTFELRAAIALANLWQKQGKTGEAYELLKEVFDWFQEGHDSGDLLEAKKILNGLKS